MKINVAKLVVLLTLLLSMVCTCFGQTSSTKSLYKIPHKNEPITILSQTVGVGDDWLKDLKIEVQNTSGKPIYYIEIDVLLEDLPGREDPLGFGLQYNRPYTTELPSGVQPLLPNDKVTLTVPTDLWYEGLKKLIAETTTLSSVNKAGIMIQNVQYGDGSGWSSGIGYSSLPNRSSGLNNSHKTNSNVFDPLIGKTTFMNPNGKPIVRNVVYKMSGNYNYVPVHYCTEFTNGGQIECCGLEECCFYDVVGCGYEALFHYTFSCGSTGEHCTRYYLQAGANCTPCP